MDELKQRGILNVFSLNVSESFEWVLRYGLNSCSDDDFIETWSTIKYQTCGTSHLPKVFRAFVCLWRWKNSTSVMTIYPSENIRFVTTNLNKQNSDRSSWTMPKAPPKTRQFCTIRSLSIPQNGYKIHAHSGRVPEYNSFNLVSQVSNWNSSDYCYSNIGHSGTNLLNGGYKLVLPWNSSKEDHQQSLNQLETSPLASLSILTALFKSKMFHLLLRWCAWITCFMVHRCCMRLSRLKVQHCWLSGHWAS